MTSKTLPSIRALSTGRTGKLVATVFASSLVLTACSSDDSADSADSTGADSSADATAESSDSSEEGRGPITFAMGRNDTDKLTPIIEKWNEEHPDEKVTLEELAGEADDQRETLVQSLQAGNSDYDVMALDVVWTADFAANQWLEPLEGDYEVDTSDLLDATVESATYRDTLYALPQNTNGQLLFRNTELVDSEPENFADLASSCEQLDDAVECLTLQLKQYEGLTVNTIGFIEGWGGHVLDGDDVVVDSDEAKAGLQALVDAFEDGTISSSSLSATEEETNLAFTEGETAYSIN